jgi:type IV fimbrial biogenesis protein FimT
MHNQPKHPKGFTLMELMVTIAITGILIGIAIPSFTSIITSNRLTTSANELITALNFARSEAIKRGVIVYVHQKSATAHYWEGGWDVLVDSNNSNSYDAADTLLKTYAALPGGYALRTVSHTFTGYFPSGLGSSGANVVFSLCNDADTTTSRTITINVVGRTQVSTDTATCS